MITSHGLRYKKEDGFTLVELAIVMIIIGLLIGGVLKGQELIDNARLTGLVKEVHPIEVAMQAFRSSYGTIPGDLPDPGDRLRDCTNDCANMVGNGDSQLSGAHPTWQLYPGWRAAENMLFWYQLAAPGLIEGVDARGTMAGARQRAWNLTSPGTPFGASGFEVHQPRHTAASVAPYAAMRGIHLVLRRIPSNVEDWTSAQGGDGDDAVLTVRQAHQVDSKLDDGRPWTGLARAVQDAFTTGCGNSATNDYDDVGGGEGRNCNMLIKIGN